MFAIFKRELRSYFTSPIGYVLLAIFVGITGFMFFIGNIVTNYSDLSGVFQFITTTIMFGFMPILTMKLWSEEKKQKTDQLLLTAPVSPTGIVLGKFFSAFTFYGIALSIMLVYGCVVAFFGSPSFATFIGNFVSTLLVGGALISIGLFISSLTESMVIAAFGSFGAIILLVVVQMLGSNMTNPVLVAIFNFLSIYSRGTEFLSGVFNIGTIVYYISIMAIFIFLTVRVVEKKRWA